jgi:hypothetical protein
MPPFSLVGAKVNCSWTNWVCPDGPLLPHQVAIDCNGRGVVYGFTCRYALTTNTLELVSSSVRQAVGTAPRIRAPAMSLWRLEDRRLTIMVESDEEARVVRLIVVSIDKKIRKPEEGRK